MKNTTVGAIWCNLQSDSAMPTGVKLTTDGKVDGHEANSCAKLGLQCDLTVAGAGKATYFHQLFPWKCLFSFIYLRNS